uniref:Smu12B n=1 Tax=uncultured organism TaxID=155900 RepID=Q0GNJ5_9ZZZZ|nr:Smu12B [uncultured organism]
MPHADALFRSLQLTEARARFELLDVTSYDVRLDLASDDATFGSVTTIRFESRGGETFLDLKPVSVRSIRLNGTDLDVDLLRSGRVPLHTASGSNELVVDAVMRFRNDGEGLHAHVDPADGKRYVYGMSFMDAAPSIFACFDQPDLKAPYTLHVTAPADWTVIGNAPGEQVERGAETAEWEFPATQPLSTYFVTLVAGPYHLIRDEHDGIPLGLSARQSIAHALEADADELFTMTKQCFDEFHRLFGIRYPFGDYHQAFVPEFNAGAMENPGCVTFRDPLVFTSKVHPRGADPAGHQPSRTRWRTSGSATSPPRSGGTTSGSTSPSPSTWATGSPPTSPSTTTRGRTTPTRAASGAWSPTRGPAPTRSPATARSTRPRRCRTSTASRTPRARASCGS